MDDAHARTIGFNMTVSKSPWEIQEIGLGQVARLADEYREIGPRVLGTTGECRRLAGEAGVVGDGQW